MKTSLITSFFLFAVAVSSCTAQPSDRLIWKNFELKDAGVKVSLPCEPDKSTKIYQEKPKLARTFSLDCTASNFIFGISLPERFGDFDRSNADKELKEAEEMLRVMIDDKATISSKEINIQDFPAREFKVKNDWTIGRQVAIVHPRGIYSVQISFTAPDAEPLTARQKDDFESVAKRYFDSFEIRK